MGMKRAAAAVALAYLIGSGLILCPPVCGAKAAKAQRVQTDSSRLRIAAGRAAGTEKMRESRESSEEVMNMTEDGAMRERHQVGRKHLKVRLVWEPIPGAVSYEVILLAHREDSPARALERHRGIFLSGAELSVAQFGDARDSLYYRVRALDFDGRAIGDYSEARGIAEGEFDTRSPLPLTEYDRMAYFPLYPVYLWIPMLGVGAHEVEIYRSRPEGDRLLRRLRADRFDVYEDGGYTYPGRYYWRVRSLSPEGKPLSDWSEKQRFEVTDCAPIAALGDSITHGGGAVSVPPSFRLYNWESYADLPVKNLGCSGNTTADMLERFDRDVLPFSPKILVVMGGINDCRGNTPAEETIRNLAALRERAESHGITPVFVTLTSLNPELIAKRKLSSSPPRDWQEKLRKIDAWVLARKYHVDAAAPLLDAAGRLRADYTTDGLHPDATAKKLLGGAIGAYLKETFPAIASAPRKCDPPDTLRAPADEGS